MNIVAALLLLPVGTVLGALFVVAFVQVTGTALFAVAALTLLPPPLNLLAQNAITLLGAASPLALLLIALLIVAVVFLLYAIASFGTTLPAAAGAATAGPAERFGRGGLIGFNSGMNLVLMLALWGLFPGGALVSHLLVLINLLACIVAVSNNNIYQVVLAYASLALPMTWLMNAAGFLVASVNAAAAVAGAPIAVFAEWTRANYIMHGGIIHGIQRTAYNMCNFTVAHQDMRRTVPWLDEATPFPPFFAVGSGTVLTNTVDGTVLHESSHTLNVGAFGTVYHLVGWADEYLPMPWSGGASLGANAHSELCAESGLRDAARNWIDMWSPATAANNTVAVTTVVVPDSAGVVVPALPVGAALLAVAVVAERNRGVTLDSTTSADADGAPFPLGRLWAIATAPAGSVAALVTPNAATPVFVPDLGGAYRIDCFLTDGVNGGAAGVNRLPFPVLLDVLQAAIATPTVAPAIGVAATFTDAGIAIPATTAAIGAPVLRWQMATAPAGSALLGVNGANSTFTVTPDLAGNYGVQLDIEQTITPAAGGIDVTLRDSTTVNFTV